ncbi:protein MODIFIER OF SNC1 1-like [Primulina huaijiensis]|uniref:protein MODIFIER OF SNC1 1-like n=1 Tax=Primulina huaijiensis TaxID=1492673 RepID=UPI003CC7543E
MNSSMLAGERRWASARRGGMTVLGKVSVPKPLNLPSQKLENHGLDPNVEIVPKGTLSWGSRPSSSGSNAWISSAPNADGRNTAHSHVSGRPSSGGSGTRPSTSESDRTNVPVANAWGSNSRPSTASGSLTSNQTSLRPRSAETRPNSSQVSRFSEPVSESSTAWGASGVGERLGVKSYKEDGFSLSSGDFPTLGSEKENSAMNMKSQDNCRPSSAFDRTARAKEEDAKFHADAQCGTMNILRTDRPRTAEDGIFPRMENWQGEPQQYFNTNIPSQHFDAWHSPPFNAPAGPWYRGRPPGPSFGGHVAPGGFPMEPFPYYPSQISHPAVGGAQSVPPAGSGPRGSHPRNGDIYRPPMPDAYARPGIPFRPEFYRGPPVPPGQMTFEGYYGPPRGYCSNEREIPFMTPRPPSYNGFQALGAHDPANFPGGTIGHGPSGKTLPVQMETDHQSQQRVPSKNRSDWYQKDEEENWDRDIRPNVLYSGKDSLPTMTSQNNEWGAEEGVENDNYAKRTVRNDNTVCNFEHQGHPSDSVRVRSIESMGSGKLVNDDLTTELPNVASFPTEGCEIPLANERNPSLQGVTKDSVLIQKQVLNAKFHVSSDGQSDSPNVFNREECRSRFQVEKKMHNCSVEGSNAAGSFEMVPTSIDFGSALHQVNVPKQSTSAVSRSSYHGGHGRVNRLRDPNDAGKTAEDSMIDTVRKIEGEPAEETSDPSDIQEQRARRRELAKQRVLQLHKEEEERTREQKAKAFAKLEELNRRTQVGETANKKETAESFDDIYGEQEILCTLGGTVLVDPKFQAPCQNLVSDFNVTSLESSISQSGESVEVSKNLPMEPPQQMEPNLSHGQSSHMKDPRNARKVGMQFNDGGISKHNRIGYKQKQNKSLVKSSHEKSVANIASEAPEDLVSVPTNFTSTEASSSEIQSVYESNMLNTSNTVAEPSVQQRRKSNSSRNKHKLDETPVFPVLSPVLSDSNPGKPSVENVESKASWSNLDCSVATVADLDVEAKNAKAFSSLPNEEAHNRVANQLKRQPFRRTLRSQQPNKFMDVHHNSDAVIWAPVRTQNKAECGTEVDKKSTLEADNATNSDNMAQSNSKGKRAEMERYVPKPVAMELAQQGNTPHMPSPMNMLKSDEVPGILQFGSFGTVSPQPVGSVTVLIASKVETKEGEDKHKIHKKEHGKWWQPAPTDSSHMKGVTLGPALISEPSKDVPKSTEQHQFINSVTNSANADTSDSHSISDNTTTSAVSKIPAMKDQGPTVRGKRNLPWVPRSTGNNPDHGDILCNEIDGSGTVSAADVDRLDRTIVSKDSRSRGDQPLSHWKPKLNSKFANNLHGNKTTGIETVTTEITGASKKDHPSQKTVQVLPQNDKRSRNSYRPQPGQSVSESNVVEESVAGNQQEFDREKKPSSAKEPPFSLNQDPINSTESAPFANTDIKHEHDISTGSRRIGKQNSRTMRGHESRGDWDLSQENRPTHAHRFRERQRRSAHYEYQPVGPHKSSGPETFDGPADGASNARLINQERGQNHPKR